MVLYYQLNSIYEYYSLDSYLQMTFIYLKKIINY